MSDDTDQSGTPILPSSGHHAGEAKALSELGSKASRASLLDDLKHLAILGETFSGQRSRTDITTDLTDSLDREGAGISAASMATY